MRKAFVDQLTQRARQHEEIVLIVGDLGFGVIDDFARECPKQFMNAGIAEQSMLGIAAGLASRGHRVFVYSIANFPTMRALEQIRNDICYHGLNVNIVSVGSGLAYGTHGYTHFAIEDISVMRCFRNLQILSPADPMEARASLDEALRYNGPSYIRLGKGGEQDLHSSVPNSLAEPTQLVAGTDLTILSTGTIVAECLKAAEIMTGYGLSARVLSAPGLQPLGTSWISATDWDRPLITVEEHVLPGGFGSLVLETLNDHGLVKSVVRYGLNLESLGSVGSQDFLRHLHGIRGDSLASSMIKTLMATE